MVSQLPVSSWHEVIGEPTIADAICDRIENGAHRINLEGDSVRKLYAERAHRDPPSGLASGPPGVTTVAGWRAPSRRPEGLPNPRGVWSVILRSTL